MAIKIEVGKFYVTRDGLKVGPMEKNGQKDWGDNSLFVSAGKELTALDASGEPLVHNQTWDSDGSVYVGCGKENGHVIVSEFVEEAAHSLEAGQEYTLKSGRKVTMTFRDECGGYFASSDGWHYRGDGVSLLEGSRERPCAPGLDVDWAASTAKQRAPLQIVAGRYYITDERKIEGPMVFCGGRFRSDVKNTMQIASGALKDAPQYWLKDGSVALPQAGEESHVLVREVAAPGFRIENGKHYVLASGETVGPMILDEADSEKSGYVEGYRSVTHPGINQVWHLDGSVAGACHGEEDQYIVREAPAKDVVTIKLDVDTSSVSGLIEEVRAEIETAAAACLVQIEEKDREIAELKRIAARRQQDIGGLNCRIESYDALIEAKNRLLNVQGRQAKSYLSTITRKDLFIAAKQAEINALKTELDALKDSFNILHTESQVSKDFADRMIDRLERKNGERVKVNLRLRKAREDIRLLKRSNKGLYEILEQDRREILALKIQSKGKEPSSLDMVGGLLSIVLIFAAGFYSEWLASLVGIAL